MSSVIPPKLEQISTASNAVDQVPVTLFRRHLGLPACAEMDDRLEELFDQTRRWFAECGEPWIEARQVGIDHIDGDEIHLAQQLKLTSTILAEGFVRAQAHAMVVVAISAGEAVDQQIDTLWKEERVDEAMFMNAYAIATVEHLRALCGEHLRHDFGEQGMMVLPHYSPGYEGWDLTDQSMLFQLILDGVRSASRSLELLVSGVLRPNKSTLAAFGITRHNDFAIDEESFWNCLAAPAVPVRGGVGYAFSEKALSRWRENRLNVTARPEGELLAVFRMDGSTCTNMGLPLAFDYEVRLKREETGEYRILSSNCEPAKNHSGYRSMCAFLDNPERFMTQLSECHPLVGQSLCRVLDWQPPTSPAGCVCSRASQDHKWRIVLQTLHFALEGHE